MQIPLYVLGYVLVPPSIYIYIYPLSLSLSLSLLYPQYWMDLLLIVHITRPSASLNSLSRLLPSYLGLYTV